MEVCLGKSSQKGGFSFAMFGYRSNYKYQLYITIDYSYRRYIPTYMEVIIQLCHVIPNFLLPTSDYLEPIIDMKFGVKKDLLNFTHIINLIISYIYHSRTYSHKIYLYQVGDLAMQPVNSCASPSSCPSGATSLAPAPLSSRYTSAPKMHHLPCCS